MTTGHEAAYIAAYEDATRELRTGEDRHREHAEDMLAIFTDMDARPNPLTTPLDRAAISARRAAARDHLNRLDRAARILGRAPEARAARLRLEMSRA